MPNNEVNIKKENHIQKEFVLEQGDLIVRDNRECVLVVVNISPHKYSLVSINDDFNRWDTLSLSLEDLTEYIKSEFESQKMNVYRNNSIDINLGNKVY